MKRQERNQQIDAIIDRLDQIAAEDREILTEAQRITLSKHLDESRELHEKLRVLAGIPRNTSENV